ncbi:MAG TPA: hypothetical protein ENF83_02525 [Candidatus Korarchaeota archaeon]|nr:hypothetical protein [Candidatus Korarchaeota archaeon]
MSAEDEELRRIQEQLQAEMLARQREQKEEEERRRLEKQRIDALVRQLLDSEAWARLKRLEMVKPGLADEVKVYLVQLYTSGRLTRRLSDAELKALLARIAERSSSDFRIRIM